jgi:hypothetical protein
VGLCRIGGIERRGFQDILGNVGDWGSMQDLILQYDVSVSSLTPKGEAGKRTQLALGSRNLQKTPSSKTSFIFLHLLRNTASMRFLSSMMPASSFAFVGFAA